MAKIDILSKNWNDILFEGRNKGYGAYELRADTGKRNLKALIALLVLLAFAYVLPYIVSGIASAVESLGSDQVTELSNIEQEEEEEDEIQIEENKPDEAPAETVTEMASSIQFTVPEITDNVAEDKELIAQQKAQEARAKMGEFNFQGNDETSTNIKSDKKQLGDVASGGGGEGEAKVFTYVEQMPVFPGGEAALQKFIHDHLKYPAVSLEEGVQGTVMLRFVVNENGSVGEVQILKSLDTYCDREAKRVVQSLPRFTPGRQQGKPVKVWFQFPIRFEIQ
ncbi:MAG: energy transducer TonB [Bacteroidaceae bacterium]|nr:energy transducer TonB [Bacteroidaceae bacterium]MBP5731316.1 energy transducer TonB [Bacteroidaceae bacterium]